MKLCTPFANRICSPNTTVEELPVKDIDRYLMIASEVLWYKTGEKFGMCNVTEAGCLDNASCGCTGDIYPRMVGGRWYNCDPGCDTYPGVSGNAQALPLSLGPVCSLEQVTVDGVCVTTALTTIGKKQYVVKCDGTPWLPDEQITDCGPCDINPRIQITYNYGRLPPESLVWATELLASEIALKVCGSTQCRLPDGVIQTSVNGTIKRFADMSKSTGTGISEVDMVIDSLGGRKRPGRVAYFPGQLASH